MTTLSVNVDHVATVREARGVDYPDPVEAAKIALKAGAAGITMHLRGDRRHIQEHDLSRLTKETGSNLNLEIAATDEMLSLAIAHRPTQVTLVPERPEEVTTEGGLDLINHLSQVRAACFDLRRVGIEVSIFLDPDHDQIRQLEALDLTPLPAVELNTDRYSRASTDQISPPLLQLTTAAEQALELGCRVFAGHGLTVANVGPIAALPGVEELNIGHSIVARSILVGMETAVVEMLSAMRP